MAEPTRDKKAEQIDFVASRALPIIEIPGAKTPYSRENIHLEFQLPPESKMSLFEKQLMEPAIRILTGEHQTSSEMFNFAKEYLKTLAEPLDTGHDKEAYEKYSKSSDHELTDKLQSALLSTGPGSLLEKQRQLLQITAIDKERKVIVQVLKVEGGENLSYAKRKEAWIQMTGAPTMFMIRDIELEGGDTSVIYVSQDDAARLLGDSQRSIGEQNTFQHEYRHSQRKFSSNNDRLFRTIDEACTNVGSAYGDIRAMLDALCWTMDGLTFSGMKEAYESGDEEKKTNILQQFEKAFGPEGLILLGARQSSEHSHDSDGLPGLPLKEHVDFQGNPDVQFMETLLGLRKGNDLDWVSKVRVSLADEKRWSRPRLEAYREQILGRITKKFKKESAPCISEMVSVMDVEIQKRKIQGEAGFYDENPFKKK